MKQRLDAESAKVAQSSLLKCLVELHKNLEDEPELAAHKEVLKHLARVDGHSLLKVKVDLHQ